MKSDTKKNLGTDIAEIAEELNVTPSGLKKQISKWAKADSSFAGFTYLGKHRPSITLDEIIEIKDRIQSNPLKIKIPSFYSVKDERESLSNVFHFYNLKILSGGGK